jgi:hypothetical protein
MAASLGAACPAAAVVDVGYSGSGRSVSTARVDRGEHGTRAGIAAAAGTSPHSVGGFAGCANIRAAIAPFLPEHGVANIRLSGAGIPPQLAEEREKK